MAFYQISWSVRLSALLWAKHEPHKQQKTVFTSDFCHRNNTRLHFFWARNHLFVFVFSCFLLFGFLICSSHPAVYSTHPFETVLERHNRAISFVMLHKTTCPVSETHFPLGQSILKVWIEFGFRFSDSTKLHKTGWKIKIERNNS